ncbi:MAG: hypothetical protein AAF633_22370, partial [Chloroflexota bacterium]
SNHLIDSHRLVNLLSRKLHYSANLYLNMGAFGEAKRRFIAAIKVLNKEKRRGWLCKAYNDYGLLAYMRGETELAAENLHAGLQVSSEIGEQRQMAVSNRRLGRLAIDKEAYQEAEERLQRSKEIHLKMGQDNRAIIAVAHLAELALKQNDMPRAKQHTEEIWSHLASSPIDWLDESLYVYLAAYRVFICEQDDRAADMKRMAEAHLNKRADSLKQPSAKAVFWTAPLHAQVCSDMGLSLP